MASEKEEDLGDASKKKETHTFDDSKTPTVLTPSLSYYLGYSDNSGTPLVAAILKGDNYRTWARSMRTALRAKLKFDFIDGSIKKPP